MLNDLAQAAGSGCDDRQSRRHGLHRWNAEGLIAHRRHHDDVRPGHLLCHAIVRQIQIRPFATYHTPEQIWAWQQSFSKWLKEGKFVFPHTVVNGGMKKAPAALLNLLRGKHSGNVLVKLT